MSNRTILILSSILFAIIIVFHLSSKKQPEGKEIKEVVDFLGRQGEWQGKIAPDFEIELLNGEKFKLSDHIGKEVIIINFFATWCDVCKKEIPELNRFYEQHKGEPFFLLGIDADERENQVAGFINEHDIKFPVGIDKRNKINKTYKVLGLPTTVFIGADGTVLVYEVGPIRNANIAFDNLYELNMQLITRGNGIKKEVYLEALKSQVMDEDNEKKDDEKKGDDGLTGRAKNIALKMDCPCGCSYKVFGCKCNTAKNIRDALQKGDFNDKSDVDVIKDLNKEFCVKDDKS